MTDLKDLIWSIGMRSTFMGYRQLVVAVELVREDREYLVYVTKRLYPAVAAATNSSCYNVERNLRTLITDCWDRGNRKRLNEIAGYCVLDKPTTKEMIGILVDQLDRDEQKMRSRHETPQTQRG